MTTTWSGATATASRSVKAVCTTGTETALTASTDATLGMDLTRVDAWVVAATADSGQTLTGGNLLAYYYDAAVGIWVAASDFNVALPAAATRGTTFLGPSAGIGVPAIAARGRFAYIPSGVTLSGGALTVWMLAVSAAGEVI